MIVNRNDYVENDDGFIGVGAQILNTQSFDKREVDLALGLLSKRRDLYGPNIVALDCGANIGVHTVEWAKHMHGWGEVRAFEAQERIYYALAGNIAINNCSNARATWSAVGEDCGVISIPKVNYDHPSSYGSLELRPSETNEDIGQPISYESGSTYEAPLLSLDSLELPRVDFIKIDVEGMEVEVLQGAMHTLKRCKPMMLIEHIKTKKRDLDPILKRAGYRRFVLGMNLLAVHQDDKIEVSIEN
jgi:FkbM family methyltransferase